jgi:1-acyl-sn-glycerol-3-phosphate acyltransferase
VIIAPVHRSNIDFAFTLFISKRKVFFMAKDSLWKFAPLGALLERLGAFPVRRGAADREAMSLAEQCLRQGHALVLFPEGTRKDGPEIDVLEDGAMFIAARTQATVVPIGIAGTDRAMPRGSRFPRFAKVSIVVGEGIEPPPVNGRPQRSAITAKSSELRECLQRVYQESLRGVD